MKTEFKMSIREVVKETIIAFIIYTMKKYKFRILLIYVKKPEMTLTEPASNESEQKLDWQAQKAEAARIRKLENEQKKYENRIEELEGLIAKLDEDFAKPENATNSAKLNELTAKRNEYETELVDCMQKWEELSVELEG